MASGGDGDDPVLIQGVYPASIQREKPGWSQVSGSIDDAFSVLERSLPLDADRLNVIIYYNPADLVRQLINWGLVAQDAHNLMIAMLTLREAACRHGVDPEESDSYFSKDIRESKNE